MKRVVIVSPLSGDGDQQRRARNQFYARLAMLDSLCRGEAPYASHLLFQLVLDDESYSDLALGVMVGRVWGLHAELAAAYIDLVESSGIKDDIKLYRYMMPVEQRLLSVSTGIRDELLIDLWSDAEPRSLERDLLLDLFPRIFADGKEV